MKKTISILTLTLALTAQAGSGLFNDPGYGSFWMNRDSSEYGISIDKAYTNFKNLKSEEIIVAVIDTGVDYNHEDLKNIMWVNPNEIAGNGIDDDQNGYIDDVHGINTIVRDVKGRPSGDPMDNHMHGSLSAGIIAAEQNNKIGIAGIASNVRIMAIKAIPTYKDVKDTGSAVQKPKMGLVKSTSPFIEKDNGPMIEENDKDVAEAILYAAKNGAKIINCSFGKETVEGTIIVTETIKLVAEKYGALLVVAASNSASDNDVRPFYPANYVNDNIIVVAATNRDGQLAKFSNYGLKSVDVAAPGIDIYSTILNNQYASYYGTSMAAPVVSGIAAEVWSKFPKLTYKEIKSVILNSTTPNKNLKNKILTGGHVDLYKALLMASEIGK